MLCVAVAAWFTSEFGPIRQSLNRISDKGRRRGFKEMSLTEHLYAIFLIICLQRKSLNLGFQ